MYQMRSETEVAPPQKEERQKEKGKKTVQRTQFGALDSTRAADCDCQLDGLHRRDTDNRRSCTENIQLHTLSVNYPACYEYYCFF